MGRGEFPYVRGRDRRVPRRDARDGRAPPCSAGVRRGGFTLFEIMLVLGFILALSVLGWPVVERAFEVQRLKKAADLVRAAWTEARVRAMTDGLTLVFRYTPETDEYLVAESTVADITNRPDVAVPASASAAPAKRLPESITFAAGEAAVDIRTEMAAATEESAVAQSAPPVFFFPDGTTSTSRLILKNTRGQQITLDLRGLTGVAIVGEVGSTPTTAIVEGAP